MGRGRLYPALALFLWAALHLDMAHRVGPFQSEDRGDAHTVRLGAEGAVPRREAAADSAGAVAGDVRAGSRLVRYDVQLTAYTSRVEETDDTPYETATGRQVRAGIVALSRDLLARYTPGAPFRYGDIVRIEGVGGEALGDFVVDDTMNRRHTLRADIWHADLGEAREFGTKLATLEGPYGSALP